MKKILTIALLAFATQLFAQGYSAPVRVVVRNLTPYNLYIAPRYHLAFFDGLNDHVSFGIPHNDYGYISSNDPALEPYHRDTNYQQDGAFEPVINSGQTRIYSNTNAPGYPLVANTTYSTFSSTNPNGPFGNYGINPTFNQRFMRLAWIRFVVSPTSVNTGYGGTLAHPLPSGTTSVANSIIPAYTNASSELFMPFGPATTTFNVNGYTVNAVWTATNYVQGQTQTVNILFY